MEKRLRFKKRNILSIIGIILFIVFLVLFLKLGLIPINTLVIVGLLILGLLLLIGMILINRKNNIIMILGIIILALSMLIDGVGIFVLHHANNFLDKAFKDNVITSTSTYYLITSKKSGLTKNDIKGDILYYESTKDISKANDKLKDIYKDITLKKVNDANIMLKDIASDTNHFMLIEKKFYSALFDFDKNLNEDDYIILDTINIKTKVVSKDNSTGNKFNIFLWGTDFTDNFMDFNMIVTVNMDTNKILLTSIPRDYYIPVAGHDGKRDKLSFMGSQGVDTVVKSVEDFFNTKIDYYVYFNAKNVPQVIDTLGGVEYCSDESYSANKIVLNPGVSGYKVSKDKIYIKEGCQIINGIEAVSVVRPRMQFVGGDAKRQEYIRKVIVGVLKKVKEPSTVANYSKVLDSLSDLYQTTLPREKVNDLVKTTIKNGGNWEIIEQSVNGEDGHDKVFLSEFIDWVKYPDENEVKNASTAINDLLK